VLLLQIISLAKVKDSGTILLIEMFNNLKSYQQEITKSIRGYIEWFILNKLYGASNTTHSTSLDRLRKINDAVKGIFSTASEFCEVGKMIIEHVICLVKNVDDKVSKMIASKELGAVGLSLLHNSFST
jgi:hypothetical protein